VQHSAAASGQAKPVPSPTQARPASLDDSAGLPLTGSVVALGYMATRAVKTVDIDAGLLDETRRAIKPDAEAADAEVIERALRFYLGRRALDTSQAMSGLSEEDALRIANDELQAMRRERRSAA
jgi:hypothetical protein